MGIGIVIPAFRAAGTIARTLKSALAEASPENIVVVLDGPDTALEDAARASAPGSRIIVLPHKQGAPVCRNLGLAALDSEYVMFLDADDYVEGNFLAGACETARLAGADLILGRFVFEAPGGARTLVDPLEIYRPLTQETVLRRWLIGGYIAPCAVVWRRAYVQALGGWDESLAKNQDGEIVHRALMAGAKLAASAQGLGIYVQDDNPDRITLKHSRRTLESQITVLDKIRDRLETLAFDPAAELASAYYALARLAYTVGVDDLGMLAERRARALGLRGQSGSTAHVMLASILGLKGKQKLARFVRQALN